MPEMAQGKTTTNNQEENDHDSGYSEEEALIILKKKRTKAQTCYRRANAAVIPDFIPPEERKADDCILRETSVFTPNHGLAEAELWGFMRLATVYSFNMEQALALLHINKYNIKQARSDLKIFGPLPSEWRQNKSSFINALKEEDKCFDQIKDRFFPNRKVADIVEYYYTWKMETKKKKIHNMLKMKKTGSPKHIPTSE